MAKIGFYGASFDPITLAHLTTAHIIATRCKLDKVIFGPGSNLRDDKKMKTSDDHRWNMLQLAIAGHPLFEADDYEMRKPASEIFSYFTMKHYKEKYPQDDVYFMMGADLLVDIAAGKWSYGEELVAENKFIVMDRDDIDMLSVVANSDFLAKYDDGSRFHLIDKGVTMEISSSIIRREVARGGNPRYMMPDASYHYMREHGLYVPDGV